MDEQDDLAALDLQIYCAWVRLLKARVGDVDGQLAVIDALLDRRQKLVG